MLIKKIILRFLLQKKNHKLLNINEIKRILFIRNAKIGDAICSFPLLRELKLNFPNSEIDVYASTHSDFLFKKLPYCKNIYVKYKKKYFYKTLIQIIKMRNRKYDLIIEAMPMKFGLELSVFFIKSKWIISLGKNDGDQNIGIYREDLSYYDKLKIQNNKEHMVEYLSSLLKLINIDNYSTKMEFPNDKKSNDYAKEFIKKLPLKKNIALNIDASSYKRSLYKDQIVELLRKIDSSCNVIILSLPSRQKFIKEIIEKENLKNCFISYPTQTIFDVAELLRVCDLLISPDTSLVHIASAINLPIVAICNKKNINLWGPKSDIQYIVCSESNNDDSIEGFNINEVVEYTNRILKDLNYLI